MRFTLSELDEMIEKVYDQMKGLDPIDPEYIILNCELDDLYREVQWVEENLNRLQEEELFFQEDFLD